MEYQSKMVGNRIVELDWSRFCYYSLICFLTPLKPQSDQSDPNDQACQFYSSDDVNRKSVIWEITSQTEGTSIEKCLGSGPIHTFLVHNKDDASHFFYFQGGNFNIENIIIFRNAYPILLKENFDKKRNLAVSLTVVETNITFAWGWLSLFYFKHVHFEKVLLGPYRRTLMDPLILNGHLESLVFLDGEGPDPWNDFPLENAINLRVLKISGYNIPKMKTKTGPRIFQLLRILNLQNNKIETLEPDFFSQKPALREVDLSNNLLKNFRGTFPPMIKVINFLGNPFMKNRDTCLNIKNANDPDSKSEVAYCPY
ncbi:uncharacterized protein LOC141850837 [Brevipalpus obovatus]|uniref:uncharacterized protein LOC141850837 n=1 Tax=Brevipalpus obovatus TaxID=246614 RepID=UPI003D9F3B91